MRIAQVSTVGTPVRRDRSGSIEHLVWLLTEELVRLGHDVTVFATAGSETGGRLEATLPGSYGVDGAPGDWHVCEWFNLCHAVREAGRFDVLHCHGYLWGLPLEGLSAAPMVHTLHVMPYESQARMWSLAPRAVVTAISSFQWSAFPQLRPHAVVHHGIDSRQYDLELQPEDYVCYLGRFIPAKGPLEAIAVARELDIRILLAGPRSEYFDRHVAPLVDGRNVDYVGYVSGPAKARLLGGARALLYPVQEPEPFGLVLIEAMMCGTPVVALELGAVAEVISFAETGYYGRTPGELAALLPRAFELDRSAIRRRAETAFSAYRMAADYARIFAEVAGSARPAKAAVRL